MKDKLLEKVAEKVAKKKLEKETGGIIDKEPDGKESDGESDGEGRGQIKSKWQQFKRKFSRSRSSSKNEKEKDKKKKKKSSSDEESEATEDDEDAMDRLGLKDAAPDAKFGTERFDDADKKGTWNVLVRVIEGKDLPSGALRVRAKLDGRQNETRTCTEGVPRWRENLCFSLKNMTLEKLAAETLTLNVISVGRIRERVGATFSVLMSAVLHSKNRSVLSKWVALHSPNDSDEEEDESSENCGFIKVSLCIYGTTDGPPHMNDDMHSDEVWSGAQLEDHTIRLRIFRLHHIAEDICDKVHKNKKKKPIQFIVRVHLGKLVMQTGGREMVPYSTSILTSDAISLEQEMYLPIQWPTVIREIRFELIMKQGSRKRVLGQASIPLRFLYEPGEEGFMPTFGPAYINFYGHEALQRLKWRNEKNPIDELSGSKYMGRLLCSLDCVDYNGDSSMIAEMGHGPLSHSKSFEEGHRYSVFCSFTAANFINPLFASKPVSFHVSMGEHGSTGYTANDYRASTFAAMPDTDKHKYFFMPWGNHRPTAEVACLWEDVSRRMARHNAINQVAAMISELMKETTKRGNSMTRKTASLCIEALDNAEELLDRLSRIPEPSQMTTELDRLCEETRRIIDTANSAEVLRLEQADRAVEVAENTVWMLARLREIALKLAEEVQISLPAIIIKMLAGDQVVGYAKINPADVFYNDNDALSGDCCGKVKIVKLKWPTLVNMKNRKEEFPGVVHVMMWFGQRKDVSKWQETMKPAEPMLESPAVPFPDCPVISAEGIAAVQESIRKVPDDRVKIKQWRSLCFDKILKSKVAPGAGLTSFYKSCSWIVFCGSTEHHVDIRDKACVLIEVFPDMFSHLMEPEDFDCYRVTMYIETLLPSKLDLHAAATFLRCRIHVNAEGTWTTYEPYFCWKFDLEDDYTLTEKAPLAGSIYLSFENGVYQVFCHEGVKVENGH